MHQIKVVVIGDGFVGKTSLISSFLNNAAPYTYVPTVFESYTSHVILDKKNVFLTIVDTSGHDEYDGYSFSAISRECDVYFLCFSVVWRASFDNILEKWYPLRSRHARHVPIVLIGTKEDLRRKMCDHVNVQFKDPVSYEEGLSMAKKIGAVKYMECSALELGTDIHTVFFTAFRIVNNSRCVVL